jgi:hypothetical protein
MPQPDIDFQTDTGDQACQRGMVGIQPPEDGATIIWAPEAFERLGEGNRRLVSNVRDRRRLTGQTRRNELVAGQEPFAIIFGCSDSRVPAEIIFDVSTRKARRGCGDCHEGLRGGRERTGFAGRCKSRLMASGTR